MGGDTFPHTGMKSKEIEQLLRAGIITPEQADSILQYFRQKSNRGRQWLIWSMSTVAGLLILGGIIMLISANWDIIPDGIKMGTAMMLLLGFWVACIRLHKCTSLLAEGLGLVGGGMWLANIALYGQIFQLQNPPAEGCTLFFAGICAIPFMIKQRILMLVVAITSIVLFIELASNRESWLTLYPWFKEDQAILSALVLLALAWWVFAEHCRGANSFLRAYRWLSIPAFMMYLILIQIPLLYQGKGWDEELTPQLLMAATPLVLLPAKPSSITWKNWLYIVLMLSSPLPLGFIFTAWGENWQLFGIAAGLLLGSGLMAMGHRALRLEWLNYGSFMVLCTGLALILNVLDSLTESGIVLIMAGGIMLVLVCLLEHQRRALSRKIKENSSH